jgi:ABC-2 type transport system ATP-binding protein
MTPQGCSARSVYGCTCCSVSSLTARDAALASVDTVELEPGTDLVTAQCYRSDVAATIATADAIAANVVASGATSRSASRGDPTLVASGLTKLFGSREVVSELSFQASTGRAFGLLGPNGSGKTTTVRLLTGLLVPSRGSVTLFGETLSRSNADALRGRIGVQTDTNLYEALSVRDNLRTWGELHGLTSRAVRRRVDEVLHVLDLSDRADSLVGELSKGMRQKLSVGRAVLHEPELLFLDEPTAGLDPEASADLIDYLKQMIRTLHTTVIICTHQLQGLESLCDDIAILKNGRLVVAGEVRQLLHQRWPQRRYLLAVDGDLASARRIVTSLTGRSVAVGATHGSLRLCVPKEESISPIVAALVRNQIAIRAVIPQQPTIQDLYFATINDGKHPE